MHERLESNSRFCTVYFDSERGICALLGANARENKYRCPEVLRIEFTAVKQQSILSVEDRKGLPAQMGRAASRGELQIEKSELFNVEIELWVS